MTTIYFCDNGSRVTKITQKQAISLAKKSGVYSFSKANKADFDMYFNAAKGTTIDPVKYAYNQLLFNRQLKRAF